MKVCHNGWAQVTEEAASSLAMEASYRENPLSQLFSISQGSQPGPEMEDLF